MEKVITFGIEVEHTEEPCPYADNDGRCTRNCHHCDGHGHSRETCPDCAGRGWTSWQTCPVCGGTGRKPNSPAWGCSYCNGGRRYNRCTTCHGTGAVDGPPCEHCGGTGQRRDCDDCSCGVAPKRQETALGTWQMKRDGSCGGETVSPILPFTEAGLDDVRQACEKHFYRLTCDPEKTCGLHIHIGLTYGNGGTFLTDKALTHLARLFARHQRMMRSLASPDGSRSNYCKAWPSDWVRDVNDCDPECTTADDLVEILDDRYYALNYQAIVRHGTVEFRLWNSTNDADEIIQNIKRCVGLVKMARKMADLGQTDYPSFASTSSFDRRLIEIANDVTYLEEVEGCEDLNSNVAR